jgi:hypothetical protein
MGEIFLAKRKIIRRCRDTSFPGEKRALLG